MNKGIIFIILGIVVLLISGCVQPTKEKEQAVTPATTAATTPAVTVATTAPTPVITPSSGLKELPPNTLYVVARMLKPAYWGDNKYEFRSLKVETYNQINNALSIKAQIISNGQVLEEKSFILDGGSNYQFMNEKSHFSNSSNATLLLQVKGYQPVEYKFVEAENIS